MEARPTRLSCSDRLVQRLVGYARTENRKHMIVCWSEFVNTARKMSGIALEGDIRSHTNVQLVALGATRTVLLENAGLFDHLCKVCEPEVLHMQCTAYREVKRA